MAGIPAASACARTRCISVRGNRIEVTTIGSAATYAAHSRTQWHPDIIGVVTAYERLSVTVPADIAKQVREAAEQAAETVSGWLTTAAQHRLRLEAGRQLLAEYEAEHGIVTEEERSAIDAEIATARQSAQGAGRARRSA